MEIIDKIKFYFEKLYEKVHHSILPDFSHDEISRGLFIKHFSIHIEKDIYSRIYSSKLNMLLIKLVKMILIN